MFLSVFSTAGLMKATKPSPNQILDGDMKRKAWLRRSQDWCFSSQSNSQLFVFNSFKYSAANCCGDPCSGHIGLRLPEGRLPNKQKLCSYTKSASRTEGQLLG